MKATATLLFTIVLVIGSTTIADETITPISNEHLVPLPIEQIFDAQQWQFNITAPDLRFIKLRLLLGEEELLSLRMNSFDSSDTIRLDVVIDYREEDTSHKWRFISTLDNCISLYDKSITLPEWAVKRHLKRYSSGLVAALRTDRRYELQNFSFEDAGMKRTIPLYLQIIVNDENVPTSKALLKWPPIADPSLIEPPKALTPSLVAEAFSFPKALQMYRVTKWNNNDLHEIPLWYFSFSDEANAFAPVHIVAFQGGTFLTPEYETRLTEALNKYSASINKIAYEEEQRIAGISDEETIRKRKTSLKQRMSRLRTDAPIRIVETAIGTKDYVQMLGLGPGGSAFGFITRSPDGKQDILISIYFSGEGKVCPVDTQETHGYYTRTREHTLDLLQEAGMRISTELFKE